MSHSLKFRKDATLDLHQADEYAVVDPLAKNSMTLEEMRGKADNRGQRKYAGDRDRDRADRGERGSDRGDRRERDDRRARPSGAAGGASSSNRDRRDADRYQRDHRSERGQDRPEVRGNWKQDRVDTSHLA